MPSSDALIRRREVERRTSRSNTSIYRDIAAGTFPPPVQIGPHAVAWRVSDIDAWIASRPVGHLEPPEPVRRRRARKAA